MKTLLLSFILLFAYPGAVLAQSIGESIVVWKYPKAKLTSTVHEASSVPHMSLLTTQAIDGEWIKVSWKRKTYWIAKQDIITFERAMRGFSNAIKKNRIILPGAGKEHADAYEGRARLWYAKGCYDAAMRDMDRSIQVDPSDPVGFILRGNIWLKLEKYRNAATEYKKALRLNPKNSQDIKLQLARIQALIKK